MDVVDVATHPERCAEIIEGVLPSGRHVLTQKPFMVDLDTGSRLCAMAREHGCVLAVNQNGRWAPHLSYMHEAAAQGAVSEVVDMNVTIHWDHNWIAGTLLDQVQHV